MRQTDTNMQKAIKTGLELRGSGDMMSQGMIADKQERLPLMAPFSMFAAVLLW